MLGVLTGFATVAVVVVVGWLLVRTGVLPEGSQQVLARLVFHVGTPALLVRTLAGEDVAQLLSAGLAVTAAAATAGALAFAGLALARRRPLDVVVVGGLGSGYVNAVNLGLPIVVFVLGEPSAVAPALLFQLAVLVPVAAALLELTAHRQRTGASRLLRPLLNPLLLAAAAGLGLSVLGVRLPAVVDGPLQLLGGTAVPCALLAFGMSLRGAQLPDLGLDLWSAVAAKLVVMPLVAWAVAGPLLGLGDRDLFAAVVVAALPTAQNAFVLALRYDRAVDLARGTVLLSTALSAPVLLVVALLLG